MEFQTILHLLYCCIYFYPADKQTSFVHGFKNKSIRILTILSVVDILFILFGPVVHYYEFHTLIFGINLLVLALGVLILFLRSIVKNYEGSIFLLLSMFAIVNSTLWECSRIITGLTLPIILLI